ncbi:MAG: phosphoribosyl-ATP diphosphatase [Pseudomonadota bacterium]
MQDTLQEIYQILKKRKKAKTKDSYTAKLYKKGRKFICKKIGEEATEVVIASLAEKDEHLISESADLLYHMMVLLTDHKLDIKDVIDELANRQGISGIEEKKNRPAD